MDILIGSLKFLFIPYTMIGFFYCLEIILDNYNEPDIRLHSIFTLVLFLHVTLVLLAIIIILQPVYPLFEKLGDFLKNTKDTKIRWRR